MMVVMNDITGPDLCHCLAATRNARHHTDYERHLAADALPHWRSAQAELEAQVDPDRALYIRASLLALVPGR
jgi:hypothetical protein